MEPCIKSNVNDITYQSELIPSFLTSEYLFVAERAGLIRPNNLRSVSCGLIKNDSIRIRQE